MDRIDIGTLHPQSTSSLNKTTCDTKRCSCFKAQRPCTVYCHTRVVGSSNCKNLQVAELQVAEESQDTEMDSDCEMFCSCMLAVVCALRIMVVRCSWLYIVAGCTLLLVVHYELWLNVEADTAVYFLLRGITIFGLFFGLFLWHIYDWHHPVSW